MSEKRSVSERLLNLVYALAQTKIGLLKDEIFEVVEAYKNSDADRKSLERMFERDKESLRKNGINITVFETDAEQGNNQESRYLISQEEVTFPADISFNPKEMALLNLAASAWSNADQFDVLNSALTKIRGLGQESEENFLDIKPLIPTVDDNFFEIQDAIAECYEINFEYLKPGDEKTENRVLRPEALIDFNNRWHVFGIDAEKQQPRTFLLSRIIGTVITTKTRFTPELSTVDKSASQLLIDELTAYAANHIATLKVLTNSRAYGDLKRDGIVYSDTQHVESSRKDHYIIGELAYTDFELLVENLVSYGPEVIVVEPEELQEAVIAKLEIALHDHKKDVDS